MNTKYLVELTDEQRQHLEKLTSSGTCSARQMKRAQILLKSDGSANWSYEQTTDAFDVSAVTIAKVRKAFVVQGLEVALLRKKPDCEYKQNGVEDLFMLFEPLQGKRFVEVKG